MGRIKHVTSMENQFPSLSIIGNNRNKTPDYYGDVGNFLIPLPVDSMPRIDQPLKMETTHHDTPQTIDVEIPTYSAVWEMLTHYPAETSRYEQYATEWAKDWREEKLADNKMQKQNEEDKENNQDSNPQTIITDAE